MRKFKFFFLALFVVAVVGCSQDALETTENPVENVSVDFKTQTNEVNVLIEYHDGVDDKVKDEVRDQYKRIGVLVRYEECDKFWDAWVINCPENMCLKSAPHENDTPVKDDPDPVSRTPIKSVIKFKDCKEIPR